MGARRAFAWYPRGDISVPSRPTPLSCCLQARADGLHTAHFLLYGKCVLEQRKALISLCSGRKMLKLKLSVHLSVPLQNLLVHVQTVCGAWLRELFVNDFGFSANYLAPRSANAFDDYDIWAEQDSSEEEEGDEEEDEGEEAESGDGEDEVEDEEEGSDDDVSRTKPLRGHLGDNRAVKRRAHELLGTLDSVLSMPRKNRSSLFQEELDLDIQYHQRMTPETYRKPEVDSAALFNSCPQMRTLIICGANGKMTEPLRGCRHATWVELLTGVDGVMLSFFSRYGCYARILLPSAEAVVEHLVARAWFYSEVTRIDTRAYMLTEDAVKRLFAAFPLLDQWQVWSRQCPASIIPLFVKIKKLVLHRGELPGEAVLQALATHCRELRSVEMAVDDATVDLLTQHFPQLEELCLCGPAFTNMSFEWIAVRCTQLRKLTAMNARNAKVNRAALESLLLHCYHLEKLVLDCANLKDCDVYEKLREKFQYLVVID